MEKIFIDVVFVIWVSLVVLISGFRHVSQCKLQYIFLFIVVQTVSPEPWEFV